MCMESYGVMYGGGVEWITMEITKTTAGCTPIDYIDP